MGRPESLDKRVRLNLEVGARTKERLVRLQLATEADSMTEVIRRALEVYEALVVAKVAGATLVLRRTGKPDERVTVL